MSLDISSLTRTGDFINPTDVGGYIKLTFGNLLDKLGNDLNILKKEVDAVKTRLSHNRGNLSGPINGNLTSAGQHLNNINEYLKIWKKIINFKRIMIYSLEHIMYDDDDITYTTNNPQFSATYIASQLTSTIEDGLFSEIYDAINAATDLTDIKNQLTEADQDGDILDDIVLDDLETLIGIEMDKVNANVNLVRIAAVEYVSYLTGDFITNLTTIENTIYDRDIETIYDTLIVTVTSAYEALYNYKISTGETQTTYLNQTILYFTNLNTQLGEFGVIANAFSDELAQIMIDRDSIKYNLISTAININSSIHTLESEVLTSIELIDETLNEVRNIFIARINSLGTLPI